MKYLKPALSGVLLLILVFALNTKFGSIPPLGKFFDPDSGFWANAEISEPSSASLQLPDVKEEISVFFDERRVPHIFAENEYDLFYAQGYITAMHRLFQMEIQTYDAAGRLSEIIGKNSAVQRRDRTTRRWGMPWAAELKIEAYKQDSTIWAVLNAYSDGVNAYISTLDKKNFPLEYKILDIAPEEWSPIKSVQLEMNMYRTLAGGSSDDRTSNTLAYFGEEYVEKFFGTDPELLEPIIPSSRTWDFDADVPPKPDSLFVPKTGERIQYFDPKSGVGSNNWAVHGSKTENGYPILVGDPHLSLSLPSIWMEIQLNAPGINAYGVSFQGLPSFLIGFNEHIAYTETNVALDIMDWYEIKFRNNTLDKYWHDNEWKKTTKRVEKIKVRGSEAIIDTIVFTHHGPVTITDPNSEDPIYHAMRWVAHEPFIGIKTFYELKKAKSYDEYVEALKPFGAGAQGFAFASTNGDIAIWINGKFPKKWKYQGRTVSDGSDPIYDWKGWIPHEEKPHIKNPERGFVSSANQKPVDNTYPYYLADKFAPYERGKRINDLLSEMENITVEDMMNMQMDNYSLHAESILPEMMEWLIPDSLNSKESEYFDLMNSWNYEMNADLSQPGFFYYWWRTFYRSIFNDEYNASGETLRYPYRDRVVEVLKTEPDFVLIDDITTPHSETIQELVTSAFKSTYKRMEDNNGALSERWNWGRVINNDIDHVGQIPGLGVENVYSGGSFEAINATRFGYGPSWRMVVELGPEVKAWGVYPGGTSGNPGSPNYDEYVENWRTGQHYELNFYKELPSDYLYLITITPNN